MPRRSGPRSSRIITITIIIMAEAALYDLLSWMSPAWPIGAFAHSSGLEWAVEAGHAVDRASTQEWLADLIEQGPLWSDAVIFVHAHRAVVADDRPALAEVAELATAMLTSHERRLESTAQGAAFRRIAAATANLPLPGGGRAFEDLLADIDDDNLAYPVVAATLFACHGIPLRAALTAFLHGAVANLVSAAQRLIPLGQTDGQLAIRALRASVFAAVERAERLPEGDPFAAMGSACLSAEIACMAHETQYTRLFRT
jgi:urease accessory protein